MLRLLLISVVLIFPTTTAQSSVDIPRIAVSYNSCSNPITLKQKRKKVHFLSLKYPYVRSMDIENDFFACSLIV